MKILVIGASGMIGHKMVEIISPEFPDIIAGVRQDVDFYKQFTVFKNVQTVNFGEVQNWSKFEAQLDQVMPDVILNCVGITLRKAEIKNLDLCVEVNGIFPHRLKCWAAQKSAYLIHFSTDCVFDGASGDYDELSPPSADDNYGRTKYLGEVIGPQCLTLRGSMIGHEILGKTELLEWALSQRGKTITGYSKALYSGVTTSVMADLVVSILKKKQRVSGLYQVSSTPISKFELLQKINTAFDLQMTIKEDSKYSSKKDLSSSKIKQELGFVCPSWDEMINHLSKEI